MIAAVVLAAGLSRRMGQDKLLLPLNGRPVFTYPVDLIANLPFDHRVLVTNTPEIRDYAQRHGFEVVPSPDAVLGMGHSVAAGAQAVDERMTAAIFLNADQPFLTAELVHTLCKTCLDMDKITVPKIHDRPSSPCVFPKRFLPELMTLTGDRGGKQVYRQYPEQTVFVDWKEERTLVDLDDPETYQRYR